MTKLNLTDSQDASIDWQVIEVTPLYRRSIGIVGYDPTTGEPLKALKTEHLGDEGLQRLNTEERNSRDGKRWSSGSGSDKGGNVPMVRVARIPMNKWASELAPRAEDPEHYKWWLERDENQPFRTKTGRL